MRWIIVFLVAAGVLFAASAWAAGVDEVVAEDQQVSASQASAVVTYVPSELREKCAGCHSIGRVLACRLDRAGWTTVVWLEMRPRQPEMFAYYYEAEPLIDFLADRYDFLARL